MLRAKGAIQTDRANACEGGGGYFAAEYRLATSVQFTTFQKPLR